MKLVINRCYGGFGVSEKVFEYLINNKGWIASATGEDGNCLNPDATILILGPDRCFGKYYFRTLNESELEFRSNPDLIEAIEAIGLKEASGMCSELVIKELPDGIDLNTLEIDEYDGMESIQSIPVRY